MAQLFGPYANATLRAGLLLVAIAPVAALVASAVAPRSPLMTGEGTVVAQPIPFSHEHHVGADGLDCCYCHTGVESSRQASVPSTHICMSCHSQLFTNASVLEPLRRSLTENQPIAWKRVHELPDYVYFDHSIHVAKGVGCTTCHGQVDQMPLLVQSTPMTMGWCLDCHRAPERFLRKHEDVFSLSWRPPPDQAAEGHALLAHYRIDTVHLTDCSVCHR
jgi:cytochrome c7-like protein